MDDAVIPAVDDRFLTWPGKDQGKPKPPIIWLDGIRRIGMTFDEWNRLGTAIGQDREQAMRESWDAATQAEMERCLRIVRNGCGDSIIEAGLTAAIIGGDNE